MAVHMKILLILLLLVSVCGLIFLIFQSKRLLNAAVKAEAESPTQTRRRQLHPNLQKKD